VLRFDPRAAMFGPQLKLDGRSARFDLGMRGTPLHYP
jgi:hypothetical protein